MNDNEIIKALERCSVGTFVCDEQCPCFHSKSKLKVTSCRFELIGEALDLINRQKAEIEKQNEELRLIRQYIHDNGLEWDLLSKHKKSKCGCFQKGERIIGWVNNNPITKTFYFCNGTKERDECSCGGDMSKCDFYPEVRERAGINDGGK